MVDHSIILDKIRQGIEFCEEIREITKASKEDFMETMMLKRSGERMFEIIVQVIVDICTYIVSKLPTRSPTSYTDCMEILIEKKIIPEDKRLTYVNIIKMRNLITHQYIKINYEILFNSLNDLISHYYTFCDHIKNWIKHL